MTRHTRLVGLLWRWHRRLGLVAAVFLVMMSISGVVLNHAAAIGLDRRYPGWQWLQTWYGDKAPRLVSFRAGDHWFTQTTDGAIYRDLERLSVCDGKLIGAATLHQFELAGCDAEFILLDGQGKLVESLTAANGLPAPITGIGSADGEVVVRTAAQWHAFRYETLEFPLLQIDGSHIDESAAAATPPAIRDAIARRGEWLSWERVLLDLHSGRIFGSVGEWVVDIAGVGFCLLGFSGVWMWWLHHRNRHQRVARSRPVDPQRG